MKFAPYYLPLVNINPADGTEREASFVAGASAYDWDEREMKASRVGDGLHMWTDVARVTKAALTHTIGRGQDGVMDYAYIEEADLVSRYVMHRLSPEEEQTFEEHFVDCAECLDRLDQTRRLREGLATAALDAAVRTRPPVTRRALALAAGVVLCVGAAVGTKP